MLLQQQALKTDMNTPNVTPVLTRTGYPYHTTWVKGVPISHKSEVELHVPHHLGIDGRLAAYELVGPTWQLSVMNVQLPFGDATDTFLEHLMEAYRQLAMMGQLVIMRDFNAAPRIHDCGGRPTPENTAVNFAMQHLGLQDLTASLRTQPSHQPAAPGSTDSNIDLCYTDPAHVEVTPHGTTTYHPKAAGIAHWRYRSKCCRSPRHSRKTQTKTNSPPSSPQTNTTHTNGWCTTARWTASSTNKRSKIETLPCGKRLRHVASTGSRRPQPHAKTCGPWYRPYGVTTGTYIQRSTPATSTPERAPRALEHDWKPQAGSSGSGASAERKT